MKRLEKFWAKWCGPCKMIAPLLEGYKNIYNIISVDIDENPELALEKGIKKIPTVIISDNEQEIVRLHGDDINKKNLDTYIN